MIDTRSRMKIILIYLLVTKEAKFQEKASITYIFGKYCTFRINVVLKYYDGTMNFTEKSRKYALKMFSTFYMNPYTFNRYFIIEEFTTKYFYI